MRDANQNAQRSDEARNDKESKEKEKLCEACKMCPKTSSSVGERRVQDRAESGRGYEGWKRGSLQPYALCLTICAFHQPRQIQASLPQATGVRHPSVLVSARARLSCPHFSSPVSCPGASHFAVGTFNELHLQSIAASQLVRKRIHKNSLHAWDSLQLIARGIGSQTA